ncbi:eukaryotic aspartyl protease family protein [Actinidia rufa]|uniref:Eukaryotic aspartyl protease family protein n=1 Tax=Actinidia rufa TaxID=165716 RepID=A0A7J0F9V9_9ERIC|nr:eukaryotic aspartyl protease family protein [Actinidia rufa]
MDTGSDLTWVPCGNLSFDCMDCDDHRNNKLMASFSPSYSSSSFRDSCASPFCIDVHSSDNSYDPCTVAGCSLRTSSESMEVAHRVLLERYQNFVLDALAQHIESLLELQVVGDLAISSKDHLQFTPMLKSPMYPNYYYIGLEGLTVGNSSATKVPLSLREFDSLGNGGMLIDSGTTYTHLPQSLYSQLLSVIQSVIPYPRAKDVEARTGFGLCYKIPCTSNNNSSTIFTDHDDLLLPTITFHFLNNVSLLLPQGNHFYAMGAPSNSTVVKCLLLQSMDDDENEYGPAGVFGSFQQQNVEVVYDLEKERIGFQPMDCASAAASQGLHKT